MPLSRKVERRSRELADLAAWSVERLQAMGAEHCEVGVASGRELEVSVRAGRPELVKEASSSGMSVRVIVGERVATSSTTDLDRAALEDFFRRALEMARLAEPDPLALPPDPKELARRIRPLDLFDPRTDRIDAAAALARAERAERAALRHDRRITASEGASFGRSSAVSALATSGGFLGTAAGTYQSLAVQAVADDEGGKKRNGVYWTGARFVEDLERPADVGREAARRAIRFLGARKIDSGKMPVVFDHEAARSIVGLVASCVLGDAVYRRRSFLADKLGKRIAPKFVTIVDDPHLPRAPGSRAYDGEGRATRRNVVVRDGVLESFLLDTHSARRLGLEPTASAAGGGSIPHATTSNFFVRKGRRTPKSLLRGIDRGLYVVRMMGFGFDPVTGNFSRGAEGFLIEGGACTVPVGEITISRNLGELLLDIEGVGNDLDHRTAIASPSLRVAEMTIAGR
ncbi:MAG: TldD/PmbA family protein [Deltaproteobacteria bacterium]|nr:MAG: TldD/PmbA family protein [Deltaproteobacteria bacterium]